MALDSKQFNFLEDLLKKFLNQHGFDKLSEQDQNGFLPQFVAEAEKRLGVALLPYLNDEKIGKEFQKLSAQDASPEEWNGFWKKNVPNFEQVVKTTLEKFVAEVEVAFQS